MKLHIVFSSLIASAFAPFASAHSASDGFLSSIQAGASATTAPIGFTTGFSVGVSEHKDTLEFARQDAKEYLAGGEMTEPLADAITLVRELGAEQNIDMTHVSDAQIAAYIFTR